MIKLRALLNLTEQAPQPPQPTAPQPPEGMNAGLPAAPALTQDAAPSPEDPSEYDFTKDFRAFEDTKNKAEALAKKKLLDKMNKTLLGKKIVANASRGYGQPKTDYTIEKVKKVSVEFWYKDWVIIVSDENDKKFFLTTGVNIKIEQGGTAEPQEPAQANAPAEPQEKEPAAEPETPEGQPEVPNEPAAEPDGQPDGQPEPPAPKPQAALPKNPSPQAKVPAPAPEPKEQPAPKQQAQPEQPIVPKKKKKIVPPQPVTEESSIEPADAKKVGPEQVQNDLGRIFSDFTNMRFDVRPYIKSAITSDLGDGAYHTEYVLEIPKEKLPNFERQKKNFELEFKEMERHSSGPGGHFGSGYVHVNDIGRLYVFEFTYSGGLDI